VVAVNLTYLSMCDSLSCRHRVGENWCRCKIAKPRRPTLGDDIALRDAAE